jgi:small redox-active disulfide protein 1
MTVTIELFYSPLCLYCPKAKKVVLEIAGEFGGKIKVEEVNVLSPAGLEKAEKYGVQGVPTIILNNKVKIAGVPTLQQLRKAIQRELDR